MLVRCRQVSSVTCRCSALGGDGKWQLIVVSQIIDSVHCNGQNGETDRCHGGVVICSFSIALQNNTTELYKLDFNWITLAALVYSMLVSCCSSFRDYFSCVHGRVMEKCGDHAAKFSEDFIKQMYSYIIQVCTSAVSCRVHITFS
jgi:hypothetical protein